MPKRKLIDNKALLKAIKDGVTKPEIMKQFGFNNGVDFHFGLA